MSRTSATLGHVLALASRSIGAEENRWVTPLLRGAVCVVIVMFVGLFLAESSSNDAPGKALLGVVLWTNWVAISLAALSFFTSTITEEKEARTLGLLKMADISPVAIVLGKSLPRLSAAVVLLTVQVPFVLLAVTLGGVGAWQILYGFWTLLVYAFALSGVATFLSTTARNSRAAGGVMVAIGALIMLSIPVIASLTYFSFGSSAVQALANWAGQWLFPILPFGSLLYATYAGSPATAITATTGGVTPGTALLLYHTVTNVLIGLGGYLLAWFCFETCTRNDAPADDARPALMARRTRRGSRRPWAAALEWKDFWFIAGGKLGVGLRFAAYPLAAAAFAYSDRWPRTPDPELFGAYLIAVTLFALPFELLFVASRVFRYELDGQTWGTLVLLPESLRGLVGRKTLGGITSIVPCLLWFLCGCVCNADDVADFFHDVSREEEAVFGIGYFIMNVVTGIALTAYYSLFTRYGSIPLAILTMGAVNLLAVLMLVSAGPGPDSGTALLFLGCFGLVVASIFLAEMTVQKLGDLAARGE